MQKVHMKKKYQYLINKRENVGLNHFNDPKAFMEYSGIIIMEYYGMICKMSTKTLRITIQ